MTTLWIYDPLVLFRADQMTFFPNSSQSLTEKINSITRVIVLFTLFGYIFTKSYPILIAGIVSLASLVSLYFYQTSREGMTPNMKIDEVLNDAPELNASTKEKVMDSSLDNANRKHWFHQKAKLDTYPEHEAVMRIDRADERPHAVVEQAPSKENPMMNVMMTDYKDRPQRPRAEPAFAPSVKKNIQKKTKEFIEESLESKLFRDLGDEIDFEQSMQRFYTTPNTQIPNDQTAFADFCYGNMSSCKDGEVDKCFANETKLGQVYA